MDSTAPVFADPLRRASLAVALARWRGTPFAQGMAVPRAGVDCVRFVREVYRDCGIDVSPAERIPAYSLHYGRHHCWSQILGWLLRDPDARRRFRRRCPETEPLAGDLLLLRTGASEHHITICGPEPTPRLHHVDLEKGVISVDWRAAVQNLPFTLNLRLYP